MYSTTIVFPSVFKYSLAVSKLLNVLPVVAEVIVILTSKSPSTLSIDLAVGNDRVFNLLSCFKR
ncbi:MAG: hypothetical protein R3Y29_01030 [bacterium]